MKISWRFALGIFIGLMVTVITCALFNLTGILKFIVLVISTTIFTILLEKGKKAN
jgi:hypothetical protein